MDFYENESISLYLSDLELIEEIRSRFHHILLYKHNKLGKVLIIDNEIMHIEKYQSFYHEPLVHLPFAIKHDIKNSLILGGGSLFAAQEILKYRSINKLVLCDHDKNVINLMGRHYQHNDPILNDSRFNYIEADALSFLQQNKFKFDLIINDCFDLSKIHIGKESLYEVLDKNLARYGLCSDMIYNDIYDKATMSNSLNSLKTKSSKFYSLMYVPEYPGVLHLHTIWSKDKIKLDLSHINPEQLKMFKNKEFEIFNPHYLSYYFYLPKLIRDIIE